VMKRALVVLAVLVLAASVVTVARGLQFRGAAKPGVHVLGIDLAGKSRAQIESQLRRWSSRAVTIRAGGRSFHVPRGWLVSLDVRRTATHALQAGSWDSLVVTQHLDVAPVLSRAASAGNVLQQIASQGRAPVSATVSLHGAEVTTTAAR